MNFTECAKIWDLHIHTNKCPKGSGEFVRKYLNDTEEFVNDLTRVLIEDKTKKVEMISFTDHNQISLDVYQSFFAKDVDIVLIPGVEIDYVNNVESTDYKHIIVYFDCGKDNIVDLSEKINFLLKGPRESSEGIEIKQLLEGLRKTGYNFIISPHILKQGKRGIDVDWTEDSVTKKDAPLYMDQFFVFWESSGYSNIIRAKEFLEKFNLKNKIPIISFSDSNNFDKLKEYINDPPQYFNSLPTFKGLAMVGSDATRIRKRSLPFEENQNPGMIKKVTFDGTDIFFSKQLNAIIGGRGSGKSVLLDAIANKLEKAKLDKKRNEFIVNFPILIKNFNDKEIDSSFEVDYFNQAYVNHLFSDGDFSKRLKDKFSDSFSNLNKINKEIIQNNNKKAFLELIEEKEEQSTENLNSFYGIYTEIPNDKLDIKILKKNKVKLDDNNKIVDYTKLAENIDDFFNSLPNPIKESKKTMFLKQILKSGIFAEVHEHNINAYKKIYSINSFIDNFFKVKTNNDEIAKKKGEFEKRFKININNLTKDIRQRNNLINSYFKITEGFKSFHTEFNTEHGSKKNRFIFSKELKIETPLEYLIRILNDHLDSRSIIVTDENLIKICKEYINGKLNDKLKDNYTLQNISDELLKFDLKYIFHNNIYYVDSNEIKNILEQSPGTQTNILMEYIVYKQTSKPLLIDQPEDNIDNKTIYEKLRKWFSKLKNERQVIVVTHDANIVINSDAENVIIAEQVKTNKFKYHYGALEFENIIEDASTILDGGKDAVKRRLSKYES